MNILICPDKFKDSLKAFEVAIALKTGILSQIPNAHIDCLPLADGGEGTLAAIESIEKVEKIRLTVRNPLLKSIKASYLFNVEHQTAYIEMAQASGIELLSMSERNPMQTSTFGTGELILHALQKGAKRIYLFVGGSATNDGGMGMACALGYEFLDEKNHPLEGKGINLGNIQSIQPSRLLPKIKHIEFFVATDVENPLVGPNGASAVFGPQKGANEEMIRYLDNSLNNLHRVCIRDLQSNPSILLGKGSGAAGGLGAGAQYFLNAKLISGADYLLDKFEFEKLIPQYDLIITGEGKIDHQTWGGKLISKIVDSSKSKKIVLVCGVNETQSDHTVFQIIQMAPNKEEAIQNASTYLIQIGKEVAATILSSGKI